MSFINLLVLIEFSAVLIVDSLSLFLMLRILVGIIKRHNKPKYNISIPIVINMICWTIAVITCLPYVCYMIFQWSVEKSIKSTSTIFWSGMWSNCFNTTISFSVFFLTLDRIFCIKYPASYSRQQQNKLVAIEIAVLVFSFFLNVWAYLQELPLPNTTIYVITKIVGGSITILVGFFFLVIIWKSLGQAATSKVTSKNAKKQRANQITGLMVCTEIWFNFLPQVGVLLLLQTTGILIAPYAGPYNVLLNSFDVLIAALMYTKTLKKFIKKDNRLVNIAAPNSSSTFKRRRTTFHF